MGFFEDFDNLLNRTRWITAIILALVIHAFGWFPNFFEYTIGGFPLKYGIAVVGIFAMYLIYQHKAG